MSGHSVVSEGEGLAITNRHELPALKREFSELADRWEDAHLQGTSDLRQLLGALAAFRGNVALADNPRVKAALEEAPSRRLASFLGSGARHVSGDAANAAQVSTLLGRMHGVLEEARSVAGEMEAASGRACAAWEEGGEAGGAEGGGEPHEGGGGVGDLGHSTWLMTAAARMYGEELALKEAVCGDLGLETPLDILGSYHTMWALQPYLDDGVRERVRDWAE